jgi:hypothetical protein
MIIVLLQEFQTFPSKRNKDSKHHPMCLTIYIMELRKISIFSKKKKRKTSIFHNKRKKRKVKSQFINDSIPHGTN